MLVGKTYSVPDERLSPRILGWTETIYGRFGTAEVDAVVAAQLLGHASVGGAFNSKIAAMSGYGVVERRQGKIRVTDAGRMIASPKDAREKAEGARSAIMTVSLWQRLHRDYTSKGLRLPADFSVDLAKIAGIPAAQASGKSDWVAKAYSEDLAYVESLEREATSPEHVVASVSRARSAASAAPFRGLKSDLDRGEAQDQILFVSQRDSIQVSVPRTSRHIAMLRVFIESALESMEQELASRNSSEKPKSAK